MTLGIDAGASSSPRQPPAFDRLSSFDNTLVYDVGYTIAEFIAAEWGQARFRELILSNGDLPSILGLSQAEFERRWFMFVVDRYRL